MKIAFLSIRAPFILHDALVGPFSLLQSHFESNVFIKALESKPNAIAMFLLFYDKLIQIFY
jgi:hypothetical protein